MISFFATFSVGSPDISTRYGPFRSCGASGTHCQTAGSKFRCVAGTVVDA